MKRILVLGAGGPAANNFIRSLRIAKEKFYIVGADINVYHLELSDADKTYTIPHVTSPDRLRYLNWIVKKEKIELVHPQPDPEVRYISDNREKINTKIFLPNKLDIQICQDKFKTYEILKKHRIPVGESYIIKNEKNLENTLKILLNDNKIVWLRAIRGAGSRAAIPITHIRYAKCWIDYWSEMKGIGYGDFIITEFLPGREFAFQGLWQDGRLIVSQARERLLYLFSNLTVSGQTSTPAVARTVHRNDINKIATSAINAIDSKASGIFGLDFKEDKNGIPCITEINSGRFFTTSNFLSEAGLNMPHLYIKLAFGEKLLHIKQYNYLPKNFYWIRHVDMGYKLIKKDKWKNKRLKI